MVFVLIPDQYDLRVASVGDVVDGLRDDEPLKEVISNAAIDSLLGDV